MITEQDIESMKVSVEKLFLNSKRFGIYLYLRVKEVIDLEEMELKLRQTEDNQKHIQNGH